MKKKFTALFIISMFLLSMIPLAFAEQGDGAGYSISGGDADPVPTEQVTDESEAVVNAPLLRPRVRQEVREEAREEIREEIRERMVRSEAVRETIQREVRQRLTHEIKVRQKLTREQHERLMQKYQAAKDHYKEVRERYMEQKTNFNRAKEAYKECKGVDSETCNEKRGKLKENAKPHLLHAADLVLKELERMRAKIEASEDLSETEIEEMLAGIDAAVAEVEDAKAAIEELDEDSPNAEYNEAAKKIREAWKTAKPKLKRTVARLANARLGNIIHQTEVLEKRLYHSLDVLEEQGKDVGELEELLAEFSAKLDVAADKYNEARALWSAANTPGEVDDAAKEIHALMKEAQDALKEARDMLREIVGEIKAQNRGSLEVEDDDSDSDASEEESDDETETEEEEESEDEDACETDADCDADEFCDEGECEDLEEEDDSEDDESGEEDEDESDEEEGEETEEE